jgi:L-asparagine transporter-like permease
MSISFRELEPMSRPTTLQKTMIAAVYAVITILTSLAEDQDAPAFLAKKGKMKVPLPAFLFTAGGLLISIIIAR